MSEFIIFDFALLCLIYSESIGLSLLLFGFITLISGDFFVNYSFLSQTNTLLIYAELLWLLGLIFILYGTFVIHQSKTYAIQYWFSRTNTIKNRLALWSFVTSVFSLLLFFTLAYFFSTINKQLFLGLPLYIMMYSMILVILSIFMGKRFESPFKKLTANIQALMLDNDKSKIDDNFSTQEFIFLQKFIIEAFETKEQKNQAKQNLFNLAAQVAHDIRSPLAAINTAVLDAISIPENKRIMIRNATKRINEIANNLLLQSKNNFLDVQSEASNSNVSPELIFVILDNIIAEKRYEYCKTNVKISLSESECSHNCFSSIHIDSFKRVLSNLINNSIEAASTHGSIAISLTASATHVKIIIEDNGCGIPSHILPKIAERGFSFNKKNGAGFGLSYAKHYLEEIDGSMHIHSEEGIGTKIYINLLRSDCPNWFCDSLNIQYGTNIFILDDDPSIHDAWNERFASISHIHIMHFYSASELLQHKAEYITPTLYLVDYELLTDIKNGLDVIEEFGLNDNAILVTSCSEDTAVRKRCEDIGVKIIPKTYVPYVKIFQLPSTDSARLVFIDDDEMMRDAWVYAAEQAEQSISTYSLFSEFLEKIDNYSKNTPIYIDSDLGNNIKGEVCAKHLFDVGFTEIYLATGYSKDRFIDMPWIKTVVGKEPPFY